MEIKNLQTTADSEPALPITKSLLRTNPTEGPITIKFDVMIHITPNLKMYFHHFSHEKFAYFPPNISFYNDVMRYL